MLKNVFLSEADTVVRQKTTKIKNNFNLPSFHSPPSSRFACHSSQNGQRPFGNLLPMFLVKRGSKRPEKNGPKARDLQSALGQDGGDDHLPGFCSTLLHVSACNLVNFSATSLMFSGIIER